MTPRTTEQPPETRKRQRRHLEMLVVSSIVIVLSFALTVRSDQRVETQIAPDVPIPQLCLSRALWGVQCPGCGLTRSFIYLANGNWTAAFAMHRIGWIMAIAVVLQLPYRASMLWWVSRRGLPEPIPETFLKWFARCLIALLIGNWLAIVVGW